MIEVSYTTIIALASLLAAAFAIIGYFAKGVRWVDNQRHQDREIGEIKEEQTMLTYCILVCLKVISEQGQGGEVVDEAIDKIEKHMNKQAHSRR